MNTSSALTDDGGAPNVADRIIGAAFVTFLRNRLSSHRHLLLGSRATGYFLASTPSTRNTPSTVLDPSRLPGPSPLTLSSTPSSNQSPTPTLLAVVLTSNVSSTVRPDRSRLRIDTVAGFPSTL